MSEHAETAPAPAASSPPPLVSGNVLCHACGYRLEGLPVVGACPECGRSVEFSIHGFKLRYADPEYLRRVRLGLTLALVGLAGSCVLFVTTRALYMHLGEIGYGLYIVAEIVFTGLSLTGYWLFSTPDRGYAGIEKPHSARRLVRLYVMLAAPMALLTTLSELFFASAGGSALEAVWIVAGIGFLGLVLLRFFAVMRCAAWIAGRAERFGLARWCRRSAWLVPVLGIAGVIAGFFAGTVGFSGSVTVYLFVTVGARGPMFLLYGWMLYRVRTEVGMALAESAKLPRASAAAGAGASSPC